MFPENRFMELLIIGALALIVVGPKDLPMLMRKVGQFVGKMRGMANEFRASFDELARQSELEELRKEVEAMRVNQQTVMTGLTSATSHDGGGVFDEINQHLSAPLTPAAPPPVVEALEPAPPTPPLTAETGARAPRAKPAAAPKTTKSAPKTVAPKTAALKTAATSKSRKAAKTASEAS
jgi:sec-independent protein translocase protein TatB